MPAAALRRDAIEAELFRHQFAAVAEEMGVVLERTGFSPNIKERRDYSCAVFGPRGDLIAQAAHIPVHLGAFPRMMDRLVDAVPWRPGDIVLCNDPAWGGTHLPDISAVAPVYGPNGRRAGFAACRAHHSDVGGAFPGSMGPGRQAFEEGLILPPVHLWRAGRLNTEVQALILANVRTPEERMGDLCAQVGAVRVGIERFHDLLAAHGSRTLAHRREAARRGTRRAVRAILRAFPADAVGFEDFMDDDGAGGGPLRIRVTLSVRRGRLRVDFTGSSPQAAGCLNAPPAVSVSAAAYCLGCLLPGGIPINQGLFDCLEVVTPAGCFLNPDRGAAVAAGNVESSQRLVDAIFGGLAGVFPERIPAASQGTMNNLALGGRLRDGRQWSYYETLGGGGGAGPSGPGTSGGHCHMSNTRNTPVEAIEYTLPVRVRRYALRPGSGGRGRYAGGLGVVREMEFLAPARASLLQERRRFPPYGLAGGEPGLAGTATHVTAGDKRELPGKGSWDMAPGDRLLVETPGGGGWGPAPAPPD